MSAAPEDRGERLYGFDPFGWQKPFVESTADEVLGSGAFGSGKTRAGCEKVAVHCLYPGNHVLICRRTHSSLVDTTMRTFLGETIPESWIVNHQKQRNSIKIRSPLFPSFYCANCDWSTNEENDKATQQACPSCGHYTIEETPPAEVSYKGLNTAAPGREMPSNILSMNLGAVYVDELTEIEEKHYLLLVGRLRLRRLNNPFVPELPVRQIFGTTNPASPQHWAYKRFYPPEEGKREVYESKTEDNPYNPADYVERLKGQYRGVMAERYIGGEWVGFEGRVYGEFSDATHVISPLEVKGMFGEGWKVYNEEELKERRDEVSDPVGDPSSNEYQAAIVTPPADARVVMSIDWGYRPDPTVVQWWAETPEWGYILYREFFQTRTLPGEVAKQCMEWMGPVELGQVSRVYADHDSGNREAWLEGVRDWIEEKRSAGQDVTDYDSARLRTTASTKDWDRGFNQVKRLLSVDDNGRAELYFIKGARRHQADRHLMSRGTPTTTIEEIRGYSWKDDQSEEAQDDNDHGADAMRYMAASDRQRRGGSGWETSIHKS